MDEPVPEEKVRPKHNAPLQLTAKAWRHLGHQVPDDVDDDEVMVLSPAKDRVIRG